MTIPDKLRIATENPDRDFETLRSNAVAVLREVAETTWTDHNVTDPGITMLEAALFAVADLHYRTETHRFGDWPITSLRWRPGAPHWSGIPIVADVAQLADLADVLAEPTGPDRTAADDMAKVVKEATSRTDAIGALTDEAFAGHRLEWAEAATVVRLLREPLLLRGALDGSDRVAAALDASKDDDGAIALLRLDPWFAALWDDELRSLFELHRRRTLAHRVRALVPKIEALDGGPADTAALAVELATDGGLDPDEVVAALAYHACPPGPEAEFWETTSGETTTWPPHPLQVLTSEPVTGDDYARRARLDPGVARAWTQRGHLPGIRWDGSASAVTDDEPGAVTILVERAEGNAEPAAILLRRVLRRALAAPGEQAEVDDPFALYRTDLDPQAPRRVICDEVGAALLRRCEVTLSATLHVPAGVTPAPPSLAGGTAVDRALERVRSYFAAGRPESAPAVPAELACPSALDGPWPGEPQPGEGWQPGEDIPLGELIQLLGDDPGVLGVSGLKVRVDGGPWYPATGDTPPYAAELADDCVPVLAPDQCVTLELDIATECGDG